MDLRSYKKTGNRLGLRHIEKHNDFLQDNDAEDNVYLDITIRNNTRQQIEANYIDTRSTTIINNPSDYYLTIPKLRVPIDATQIFDFRDGAYQITVEFGAFVHTEIVAYIPQNVFTTSRAIFAYQDFVQMVNVAFRNAMVTLWGLSGGTLPVPDPTVSTNPVPQLIFVNEQTPMSIRFPEQYNSEVVSPTVNIYFNYDLYIFFQNFAAFFGGDYNIASGVNGFLMEVFDQNNNYQAIPATAITSAYNAYVMTQDSPTFANWWDIKEILILSNTLPVTQELISARGDGGVEKYLPILTDVSINFLGTEQGEQKNDVLYIPDPQYRLISLITHNELKTIDFHFVYRTFSGEIKPILLAPNTTLTMKLLFVKRSLFNHSV